MATVQTKLMTAEDFYDWLCRSEHEDKNWELDRGRAVEVPFGSERHGFVCANINCVLADHIILRHLGHLCLGTGVIVERNPDTVFVPDVAYYTKEENAGRPGDFFAIRPPKLAVEVLDSGDRITRINRRIYRNLKCGVSIVWLVDSGARSVTVYRPDRYPIVVDELEGLTGEEVLPDFRCKVAEFFALPGQ